ncbi:hypothetical protein Pryu01_01277 [Paraliobacillus ryukyuensis]|uniref:Prepilin-type N-terminal cleavage/methylation domain-containing protein n=1 Tax=Paraliobacillus ryukyuensis TaxID=200904 RepID=A0A366ECM4_9BACI|nr:prepilin-type N-terminal cleavage/methylation domain-containing protein [Paraliobacillus ryukyuensis]RBO99489.1 prepilin-type N-terminal cleavage/methylation domain-containing protein [Paraliobacillus ryukyuensis]
MREERGMTLVELLAALALLSIIIMLVGSVMFFGQKQYSKQTETIAKQDEVRFVMSTITKAIRSHHADEVTVADSVLTIGTDQYKLNTSQLLKNSVVLSDQIAVFNVIKQDEQIDITIGSTSDEYNEKQTLSTVIYLRE